MKSVRRIGLAVIAGIFWLVPSAATAADQMPWVEDLATAQRIAASRNQLVLIHFMADSCPPCRRLEKNVFSERTFAHGVGLNYVPVRVNVSTNPSIAEHFSIKAWPTDVIVTPNGDEVHRMISPQSPAEYSMNLRQIAWRFKSQRGSQQVAVAAFPMKAPKNTMPVNVPQLGTNQADEGYQARTTPTLQMQAAAAEKRAGNNNQPTPYAQAASRANEAAARFNAQPVTTTAAAPPSTSGVSQAQYAQHRSPSSAEVMTATAQNSATNTYATAAADATAAPPAVTSQPQLTPVEATEVIVNSFAQSGNSAASQVAVAQSALGGDVVTNPFSSQATHPAQSTVPRPAATTQPVAEVPQFQQPPTARPAQAAPTADNNSSQTAYFQQSATVKMPAISVAMEGYCPVTLIDENDWVKGDRQWGARHRGRVFLFQSLAAQQRFLADPERYSPILVGFDPVAFKDLGLYVEGKRQHGIRFKDQIVLFGSESSLEQFASSPENYMQTVYQAMQQTGNMTR